MHVDLRHRHAQGALYIEFYQVHNTFRHRGDASAIFYDHVNVYDDLVFLNTHIYTVAGVALKNVGHSPGQIFGRDADDTIGARYRLAGDSGNRCRGDLDLPQIGLGC